MRCLGARRHETVLVRPRAGGAIAHGEDVVVSAGLQGLADGQLVDPVGFQPVEASQELGTLYAGCPYHQFGGQDAAIGEADAVGQDFGHLGVGMHLDAELAEQHLGRCRQPFRQRREDARGGLDHRQLDVLVGIDAVEPVGHYLACGVMEFGGQLDAGCAGADDRHVQLAGAQRRTLGMGAHAGIDHAHMKAPGVGGRFQLERMLAHARGAEVVALAANSNDQRVVGEGAGRRDLFALFVEIGGDMNEALTAVEPTHLADAEMEAMPVCLRQVADLVLAEVYAAGGDLVQLGFPDVGARAVDQRDVGLAAPPQCVAEARGEFEATGAAADDDDSMQLLVFA